MINRQNLIGEWDSAARTLLERWKAAAPDEENGGYFNVSCWNEVMKGGEKSATLNFRIFWTFSEAFLQFGDARYLAQADRAFRFIRKQFLDPEYGGVYPILNAEGQPISTEKHGYVHSFAIAAFAAYFRASGNEESLKYAEELFRLVEEKGRNIWGGYHDVCTRDWQPVARFTQTSPEGEVRDKMLRPNMHMLWGFEQLRLAKESPETDRAVAELAALIGEKLTDPETAQVGQAFAGDWKRVSDRDDYGDDFETAWILWDALGAFSDAGKAAKIGEICRRITRHALLSGTDREYGGIYQQYHHGKINTDKEWWVQAEAVNGLLTAYRETGEEPYLEAAAACWNYIREQMIQPDGSWIWKTKRNGERYQRWEIRGPLMCPYHSGRMLMRSAELLKDMDKDGNPKEEKVI